MAKRIFIYGGLSGLVIIISILIGLASGNKAASSEFVGYLIMVIALAIIFVGIKRHRDLDLGGVIRFLPAFGMGLGIAAVASLIYVVVWEIYLASTGYVFIEQYAATVIEQMRSSGASTAEIEKMSSDMASMAKSYANPLFRTAITFTEIFPVGFIVALVSAAILRNPRVLPRHAPAAVRPD